MSKYRLINLQTKEEHLCDKVTIDGFDYYLSDEHVKENDGFIGYRLSDNKPYIGIASHIKESKKQKGKIIACNNPNIDIPKVVVAAVRLAEEHCERWGFERILGSGSSTLAHDSFVFGYNKSQETHPFSEEDMIEFLDWVIFYYPNQWKSVRSNNKGFYTTKELLQFWKEQRPKIVYYE